jgi:hypothetical protein
MATLFSDNFNRADSDTLGGNWVETGGDHDIVSNHVECASISTTALVTNSTALGTADYTVTADITVANFANAGLVGRYLDANNYYLLHLPDNHTAQLYKYIAGSFTQLGSTWDNGSAIGTATFTLSMQGNAIKVLVNGVQRITATDGSLTAEGDFGFRSDGNPNLIQYDNLVVADFATGTIAVSPTTLVAGSTGNSVAVTGTGTAWTAGTPGTPTLTASSGTITAQSVTDATHATLTFTAPGSPGTVTITDPSTGATATITIVAAATSYTLTGPSAGSVGVASTNFTVALPASRAVSAAVTVTPSSGGGGGTFTPATVTLLANTVAASATFTYTPASTGVKTISTSDNGGLTDPSSLTYTVTDSNIAITDANLIIEGSWHVNSTRAKTIHAGAALRLGFTGTTLAVRVTTGAAGLNFKASIDGGSWASYSPGNNQTNLAVNLTPTPLAAGTHDLLLFVSNNYNSLFDHWTVPDEAISILGFTVDVGSASAAPRTPRRANDLIVFGDSITWGSTLAENLYGYGRWVGYALDAEVAQVAQPGIGWSVGLASPVNYPPFHTIGNTAQSSWRWHWAGQARDLSGYDYILANLGTNESGETDTNLRNRINDWLTEVRLVNATAWIFVMVPVSGRRRNVFNTLTLPDSRVKVIDLDPSGNDLNLGLGL